MLVDNVSRRDLLKLGAAGALSLGLPRAAWAQAAGPIVKPLPPEWFTAFGSNAEMRWDAARDQGYLIEPGRFFVRNHTSTPAIDAGTWRLRVSGAGVRRPLELSYRQLERLACESETAFIECAGNGRSFFGTQQGTPASGTQWRLGAIGVARWRGVRLRDVLELAGIRRSAVDVLPTGLDPAYVSGGVDYGHVRRPLPVAKALDDALIALEMNGRELPPDHGFPARLVVPGWVGIANIKWLGSIEVGQPGHDAVQLDLLSGPHRPERQERVRARLERRAAGRYAPGVARPLVVRPCADPPRRRQHRRRRDLRRAKLRGPNLRNAWARWELPWTPAPGAHELLARATDRSGLVQPDTVEFNSAGYGFWAVVRHPVTAS
jgi:DMSO/TMAO reductase YedYZ molybdopterin-dependent catalytic subunit